MKSYILLPIVLLLVIAGCSSTQFVCPDGTVVDDASLCTIEEADTQIVEENPLEANPLTKAIVEKEKVEEKETIPTRVEHTTTGIARYMDSDVRVLIEKSWDVQSVEYDYKRVHIPEEPQLAMWVKGDKAKQSVVIETDTLYQNAYDVIVFDTSRREAYAFCEQEDYCEQQGEYSDLPFEEHFVWTPFTWLTEIRYAEVVGGANLFNRKTHKISVNDGEMEMWLDDFFGVPLKVVRGEEQYEFRNPDFNSLTDEDVGYVAVAGSLD